MGGAGSAVQYSFFSTPTPTSTPTPNLQLPRSKISHYPHRWHGQGLSQHTGVHTGVQRSTTSNVQRSTTDTSALRLPQNNRQLTFKHFFGLHRCHGHGLPQHQGVQRIQSILGQRLPGGLSTPGGVQLQPSGVKQLTVQWHWGNGRQAGGLSFRVCCCLKDLMTDCRTTGT